MIFSFLFYIGDRLSETTRRPSCAKSPESPDVPRRRNRHFRDSLLGIVAELRSSIMKRFGFVPFAAQEEINAFVAALSASEGATAPADEAPAQPAYVAPVTIAVV